jgi:hypothetical protein
MTSESWQARKRRTKPPSPWHPGSRARPFPASAACRCA